MSIDEIRHQKALAWLEFKEAEDRLRDLEKQKDALARDFTAFATKLQMESREDLEPYAHLSWRSTVDLLEKVADARRAFVAAKEKKDQFGL